jgi:hypothetical protein
MSLPKDIAKYPKQLHEAARSFPPGSTVVINCQSKKEAQRMRFMFYGFRKAVKESGASGMYPDLDSMVAVVAGTMLRFSHADDDPAMQAFDAAFRKLHNEQGSHVALGPPKAEPADPVLDDFEDLIGKRYGIKPSGEEPPSDDKPK